MIKYQNYGSKPQKVLRTELLPATIDPEETYRVLMEYNAHIKRIKQLERKRKPEVVTANPKSKRAKVTPIKNRIPIAQRKTRIRTCSLRRNMKIITLLRPWSDCMDLQRTFPIYRRSILSKGRSAGQFKSKPPGIPCFSCPRKMRRLGLLQKGSLSRWRRFYLTIESNGDA
jgi:hypothetical protein